MTVKDTVARKLESRKSIDAKTGCWVWGGAWRSKDLEPVLRVDGKIKLVKHLSAWLYLARPLDAGDCVMRRCECKACFNPDHLLRVASPKAASRLAARMGKKAKGSRNGRARLTEIQALRVIEIAHDPQLTEIEVAAKLAREFRKKVNPRNVRDIQTGRTWGYLQRRRA